MSKYFDITKAYILCEGEQPPEHLIEFYSTIQGLVDRAYQDGYEACIRANLFGEDAI